MPLWSARKFHVPHGRISGSRVAAIKADAASRRPGAVTPRTGASSKRPPHRHLRGHNISHHGGRHGGDHDLIRGCARSQRAALINAVTVIIRKSRIDAVSLKAARGPRPRCADHTMLCRFFRLRRRRHIIGVGVAAAGEITERAARRSDGRQLRWD